MIWTIQTGVMYPTLANFLQSGQRSERADPVKFPSAFFNESFKQNVLMFVMNVSAPQQSACDS
jgi:hypothetical protein